jgi:hypothetical protein
MPFRYWWAAHSKSPQPTPVSSLRSSPAAAELNRYGLVVISKLRN